MTLEQFVMNISKEKIGFANILEAKCEREKGKELLKSHLDVINILIKVLLF